MVVLSLASCTEEVETYTVEEKTLNEAVYASGEIYPEEYEFMVTANSEQVLRIMVEEGDKVKGGDVLAVLGTPSEKSELNILSNQVALARQNTQENEAYLSNLGAKSAWLT